MTDGPIEVNKSSRMGAFFVRERNLAPRGYYAIDETGNEGNIFVDNSAQCKADLHHAGDYPAPYPPL